MKTVTLRTNVKIIPLVSGFSMSFHPLYSSVVGFSVRQGSPVWGKDISKREEGLKKVVTVVTGVSDTKSRTQ